MKISDGAWKSLQAFGAAALSDHRTYAFATIHRVGVSATMQGHELGTREAASDEKRLPAAVNRGHRDGVLGAGESDTQLGCGSL